MQLSEFTPTMQSFRETKAGDWMVTSHPYLYLKKHGSAWLIFFYVLWYNIEIFLLDVWTHKKRYETKQNKNDKDTYYIFIWRQVAKPGCICMEELLAVSDIPVWYRLDWWVLEMWTLVWWTLITGFNKQTIENQSHKTLCYNKMVRCSGMSVSAEVLTVTI